MDVTSVLLLALLLLVVVVVVNVGLISDIYRPISSKRCTMIEATKLYTLISV